MFSTADQLHRQLTDMTGRAYADCYDAEAAHIRAHEDLENINAIIAQITGLNFDPRHIAIVQALVDPSRAPAKAPLDALTAAEHRHTTAKGAMDMSAHHLQMQAQGAAGVFYGADPGPAGGNGRIDLDAHVPTGGHTAGGTDAAGGPRPDPNATPHRPCDSCGNPEPGNRTRVHDTRTDYICDGCVGNHNWSNWQVQPDGSLLHSNATSPAHPTAESPEAIRARDRVGRAAAALEEDAQREHLPASVVARKRAGMEDLRRFGRALATGRKFDAEEAKQMALAGECSGIVIDNWRNVESQLSSTRSWDTPEVKEQVKATYDRERKARDRLVRDGYLVRVDETIDGVKQVPYYALASYGGLTREEAEEFSRRQAAANAAAVAAARA